MATTLSEFYNSQGKALPSVKDRSGVAAQAGIQGYTGTAAQNAQLLGFLSSNQGGSTPSTTGTPNIPTIPAQNINSGTQPLPLPEKPPAQAPTDIYTSSVAYLNTIPKTGVKGLDEITTAMVERPGQLNQQFGLEEKRALAEQTKNTLDAFNEEYRVKAEQLRVDNSKTAASKQVSIEELERNRAFKAGSLAIEAAFRNNDFVGAQTLMNQQLQLELEPLKMRYKFFEDMYNRTEDQKFQRAMKAEDRAYEAKKAQLEMENEAKLFGMTGVTPTLPTGQPDISKKIAFTLKTAKKDVTGAEAALGVINSLQKLATENAEGRFIGLAPVKLAGRLRGKESRSELIANRSDIEAINLKVQQWASGASLTDEQTKQVKRLVPDKNDSDFKVKEKINNLTNFMQNQIQASLATKGVYYQPEPIDWFADPVDSYVDSSILKVTDPYEEYLMQVQGTVN